MTLRLTSRLIFWGVALAALLCLMLCLAGCGDGTPAYTPPAPGTAYRRVASAPALPVAPPSDTGDDPLAASDPLGSGGDALGGASTPADGPTANASPTLDASATLDDTPAHGATADPLAGRGMPTAHSHWLNVEMHDARVTVRLNGMQIGSPDSTGTRDVTMRLHRGTNFLTLTYAPRSARAWTGVTVVEGEHHPPIAPLVSFHVRPLAETLASNTAAPPHPTFKTIVFVAR